MLTKSHKLAVKMEIKLEKSIKCHTVLSKSSWTTVLNLCLVILLVVAVPTNTEETHYQPALECNDPYGRPQRCVPEFENAAYNLAIEATNTCGEDEEIEFCVQTGYANRKSCDYCRRGDHSSLSLTDIHDPLNPSWWQSETMFEGIQHPNQVNLTLHLGKSFDITYIRIVFYSPRPESFAIYKRERQDGPWMPYQYYSATCRDTYGQPDTTAIKKGEDESRALCTSEYSDISPLRDGNIAFSSLEGRPSAIYFEHSPELQQWVTATDILISLDRLNTFGDELFGDAQVLKSYFYAIADIAVGARCKCNGHASKCVQSTGPNGERTRVCECRHFTDGPDCERCLPFYNDAPWGRATSKNVHECKPCNCNGFSNKCYFDRALYNLTGHGGHCIDCAANRDGANCERCKENYYMRDDGYCVHCGCDAVGSRSLQCNTEGKCQCKPGVTGDKCDRCEANYYNFGPHGCQPCNCDPRGSEGNTPSCDPETGICFCKENVEGRHCRECRPGFFNLDLDNKFGCTPCFCYGHTSECASAPGYSIVSTTSNFNKHKEKWTAIDRDGYPIDIKYNLYSQNIGVAAQGNSFIYFLAPDRFLGDQRASYNRLLKFRLQLVGQTRVDASPYDVILEGSGSKISLPIFAQENRYPDQQVREYAFRLHENSEYAWQPTQSSRSFMQILSNLTAIKIRATFSPQGEGFIDDVELQTAHRGAAGRPATWIEQCTCPEGYLGQFCESCAPGYRHTGRGGPFMPCIPCDCNKHADICDSETGRCICQHNTAGETCDQCAKGYYGNALGGTPFDCKRCPCPDNGACMQMPDESVICLECPTGYVGTRCELCSDGYFGDPTGITGNVQICQPCDCNGNVDPNAVGNCNRTTGECLKCIHNTAGSHCDQCLPGYFGDPFATPHGQCEPCTCYPRGTEQTEDGINICKQQTGNCVCKQNVIGRDCNECKSGYWNIASGNGCESCNCDPIGSYNSSCDTYTGQCFCKPGVTGAKCDKCEPYQYGFSADGCKPCDCDPSGSKGFQCDQNGQCPCNDNVEGRRCDRCKENKYDRHQGCIDCPHCYNLVQDAVNEHRAKLEALQNILKDIANNPTVSDDVEFESKLKATQEKLDILLDDAKAGAGGGELTLIEKVNDLHDKLNNVRDLLNSADTLQETANNQVDTAGSISVQIEKTIQAANAELNNALDLLQTEGAQALQRAKDRSAAFDNQSKEISEISRDARQYADQLEAEAQAAQDTARDALEKATKAFEIAKNTTNLQQLINADLKQNVSTEIQDFKTKIETVKRITDDALEKANEVYDEALTLFASVNSLTIPDVDTKTIKSDAKRLIDESERILKELDEIVESHAPLISEIEENIELAKQLVNRAVAQKEEALQMLEDVEISNKKAEDAVKRGSKTLTEANNTYHTLTEFHDKVQQSKANAELALNTISDIEYQIREAEELVDKADRALEGARSDAESARRNAQEAQEKYAEQASKDADTIRRKANETKFAARDLRNEADNLNLRVGKTEERLGLLETAALKEDGLTKEAKTSVGQASADAIEAQKQVEKALKEVKAITDELESLRDIDVEELNRLEKKLNDAEEELRRANLNDRLETLNELKNNQNRIIKSYKDEISQLEAEVENIRSIAEALPDGCFKRVRLEP